MSRVWITGQKLHASIYRAIPFHCPCGPTDQGGIAFWAKLLTFSFLVNTSRLLSIECVAFSAGSVAILWIVSGGRVSAVLIVGAVGRLAPAIKKTERIALAYPLGELLIRVLGVPKFHSLSAYTNASLRWNFLPVLASAFSFASRCAWCRFGFLVRCAHTAFSFSSRIFVLTSRTK